MIVYFELVGKMDSLQDFQLALLKNTLFLLMTQTWSPASSYTMVCAGTLAWSYSHVDLPQVSNIWAGTCLKPALMEVWCSETRPDGRKGHPSPDRHILGPHQSHSCHCIGLAEETLPPKWLFQSLPAHLQKAWMAHCFPRQSHPYETSAKTSPRSTCMNMHANC